MAFGHSKSKKNALLARNLIPLSVAVEFGLDTPRSVDAGTTGGDKRPRSAKTLTILTI
jgi:hypothetical protein